MTKAFARILLIAYTSLLLRPWLPFVSDFLAHTFWYAQHVATVHYEHGSFHVHYEYLEAAQKSAPDKTDHSLRAMISMGDHVVRRLDYRFAPPMLRKVFGGFYLSFVPSTPCARIDPPPES